MDAYVTAVLREAEILARRRAIHERNLTFAYFGGGTPSVLPPQTLRRLFPGLKSRLPWNSINEITFECAPKSTTPERMTVARDIGVTRVSMGVQQMDDALLRRNGRIHLVRDVERAYTVLRRAGFEYVNLDFIAGLVGETDEAFHRSLDRLISLEPESITIYPLEVPRNTRLYRSWASVERDVATWSETRRRIKAGFGRLLSVGYSLRSAYTAVRDPRRYLFAYQDSQYRGADFVGLGPSSFSYVAGVHFQNTSSLTHYHEQISGNLLPLVRGYRLGGDEQFVREFVLQLKLGVVDRSYFADKFGIDVCQRFSAPLRALAANGDIMIGDRVLVLTLDGLVRVDRLMPLFYRNEHQAAPYW
jgi:oxygen-independent coproporphyrinogen-3 oxidase